MKFEINKNERVAFFGEVFATREQAEQHSDNVTFVADCYAALMGYPCGGFVPLNDMNQPKQIHTVAH